MLVVLTFPASSGRRARNGICKIAEEAPDEMEDDVSTVAIGPTNGDECARGGATSGDLELDDDEWIEKIDWGHVVGRNMDDFGALSQRLWRKEQISAVLISA